MKTTLCSTIATVLLAPGFAISADAARPMLDSTHDRVQTTLAPNLNRIGTIEPRGAKEVGRSNLAIGCEMLDRDYTVQNIASVFDGSLEAAPGASCDVQCAKKTASYLFKKAGSDQWLLAFWDCSDHPGNTNDTTPARITLAGVTFADPVWVDTVTGAIYELPADRVAAEGGKTLLNDIPLYDAPAFITDKRVVLGAPK